MTDTKNMETFRISPRNRFYSKAMIEPFEAIEVTATTEYEAVCIARALGLKLRVDALNYTITTTGPSPIQDTCPPPAYTRGYNI